MHVYLLLHVLTRLMQLQFTLVFNLHLKILVIFMIVHHGYANHMCLSYPREINHNFIRTVVSNTPAASNSFA